MKKLLNKKGFTLIELIVVIAILAILALILVPSILRYVDEANKSRDQANARALYSELSIAIALQASQPGALPTTNLDVTDITVPVGCEHDPDPLLLGTEVFTVTCNGQTFNGSAFTGD